MKIPRHADEEDPVVSAALGSTEPELAEGAEDDATVFQSAPGRSLDEQDAAPPTTEAGTQPLSDAQVGASILRSKGMPSVPGYEVLRYLGAGTFGEVWLARERRTGVRVAIKFFKHGSGGRWGLLQAEVQQLAQLHSDPGIVHLIGVEPDATPPYYVMAFIENGSLADRLERGPLPLAKALEVFRQAAEALAYVHAKGIRHCDLKPSNILLDVRGRAWLADFGQAHLSSDASPALGTFFYMAPEQADLSGQIADTRWDVYALGAVLYAMLTGGPPRENAAIRDEITGTAELSHRLARYREWVSTSPRPRAHRDVRGIDRHLVAILDRCLEVDPAARLRDAGAVLAALERRRRTIRERAMLGFGLIAPVALMLVMAAMTLEGAERAIKASQNAMADQLCRSDSVSAHLAAQVVQEQIGDRLDLLEGRADEPALAEALDRGDRDALRTLLDAYGKEAEIDKVGVARWTIADWSGTSLANYPWDPLVAGKDWSWRDWFNGQGDQLDRKGEPFPPISRPHISQPFVGKTRVQRTGIVLSAPVRDPQPSTPGGKRPIIGVLAMTIDLRKIENWLRSVQLDHGFAVLVDGRYHCLVHDHQDRIVPGTDRNPPTWDCPTYRDLIGSGRSGRTLSYRDPIDGEVYLAGFAPLPKLGWGVIVQHNRERVLAQIAGVTYRLMRLARVAFVAAGLLISVLWGWQFWTLRRVQRMADA